MTIKMPIELQKKLEIEKCNHGPNSSVFYNGYDTGAADCHKEMRPQLYDVQCLADQLMVDSMAAKDREAKLVEAMKADIKGAGPVTGPIYHKNICATLKELGLSDG